jgi:hypothetical protein
VVFLVSLFAADDDDERRRRFCPPFTLVPSRLSSVLSMLRAVLIVAVSPPLAEEERRSTSSGSPPLLQLVLIRPSLRGATAPLWDADGFMSLFLVVRLAWLGCAILLLAPSAPVPVRCANDDDIAVAFAEVEDTTGDDSPRSSGAGADDDDAENDGTSPAPLAVVSALSDF